MTNYKKRSQVYTKQVARKWVAKESADPLVNCYSCDGLVYLSECIPADNNVGGCICTRCVDTWSTGNKERKTK